ncbi:hypothetical protein PI124_g18469 [Phytophthora idaei]|nr:hypothetical protein PI125_g19624 [Phytophthora idaei]KAG3138768.1 hypothetical protein PI126_g16763 [Phytophthora idaei]KAG3236525.1 hypothetical protein PI124_g18469 [Phytophthora idaei]
MRVFSVFLKSYNNNATVLIPPLKKQPRKTPPKKDPLLPEKIRAPICAGAAAQRYVLMSVNFDGVHWGCLVIERHSETIQLYDSVNSKKI